MTCCRDLIGMKQRGDRQAAGAGAEQLVANAIVQAYCSTLDAYINAQVVNRTQYGTCVVTLLGVTETLEVEVSRVQFDALFLVLASVALVVGVHACVCACCVTLLQVQSLRPGVPADPAQLPSGSKCDAV